MEGTPMKVCPNCGKDVSQYSERCYFCEYDFNNAITPIQTKIEKLKVEEIPANSSPLFGTRAEPTGCMPWGYVFLIIVANVIIYVIVELIGSLIGTEETAYTFIALEQLVIRIWIGVSAAKAYKKGQIPTGWNYFGWIIMAFVPILSWVAMYNAGKFLAWRMNVKETANEG